MPQPSDAGPSRLAWELLEEFERDPTGLGYLDVEKLLGEFGFTEPLPGRDVPGYRTRGLRNRPDAFVYYPLKLELAPEVVLAICARIRGTFGGRT